MLEVHLLLVHNVTELCVYSLEMDEKCVAELH